LERDQLVLNRARTNGIPIAIAMAGGYAHDVNDIVDIHATTVAAARRSLDQFP
jgi:hypothetical protein